MVITVENGKKERVKFSYINFVKPNEPKLSECFTFHNSRAA